MYDSEMHIVQRENLKVGFSGRFYCDVALILYLLDMPSLRFHLLDSEYQNRLSSEQCISFK